jgi:hypothetical protein
MKITTPTLRTTEDCISFAREINPAKQPLTIEKLRSFLGCEHYTDEEAASIVQTIDHLSHILFECTQDPICIDNEQVVHLKKASRSKTRSIKNHINKAKTIAA